MYKVKVEKECACFKRSGLPVISEYETEEEAKKEAQIMCEKMNSDFCHKHEFSLNESFGDFSILMKVRA